MLSKCVLLSTSEKVYIIYQNNSLEHLLKKWLSVFHVMNLFWPGFQIMLLTSRWLKTCYDNAAWKWAPRKCFKFQDFTRSIGTDPLLVTICTFQTTFNCILDHLHQLFHYTVLWEFDTCILTNNSYHKITVINFIIRHTNNFILVWKEQNERNFLLY